MVYSAILNFADCSHIILQAFCQVVFYKIPTDILLCFDQFLILWDEKRLQLKPGDYDFYQHLGQFFDLSLLIITQFFSMLLTCFQNVPVKLRLLELFLLLNVFYSEGFLIVRLVFFLSHKLTFFHLEMHISNASQNRVLKVLKHRWLLYFLYLLLELLILKLQVILIILKNMGIHFSS